VNYLKTHFFEELEKSKKPFRDSERALDFGELFLITDCIAFPPGYIQCNSSSNNSYDGMQQACYESLKVKAFSRL
jgi:hypothetical protein